MKFTAILILCASFTVSANSYSQRLTLSLKNVRIETAFLEIKKQSGFSFLYGSKVLQVAKPVSLELKNASLEEALEKCFKDQALSYNIVQKTIIVKPGRVFTVIEEVESSPIDISGRITDDKGDPVVASIQEKGTNNGTTSNADGRFELKNVDDKAVLVITGINIEPSEWRVNGRTGITIVVKRKIDAQDEVTINAGYYQVRDRERTGSISKLPAAVIEQQPVANVLHALQSRLPGVIVSPRTGVSGGFMSVEIRGQNSLRFDGNYPLYVVDGVPVESRPIGSYASMFINGMDPLNAINPANIESIEVLKDADATAIYGSRGANGVILITTKRAKAGKTSLDINIYTGSGKVPLKMDLLNTQQFLQLRKEGFNNDGPAALADLNNPAYAIYYPDLKIWDSVTNTDWQKVLFGGTARVTDIQLALSGGSETTSFRFGGAFRKETTVFPGNFGYQRGNGNLQVNHRSADKKFSIQLSANFGVDNNRQYSGSPVYDALTMPPNAPTYNADGSLNWLGYGQHPLAKTRIGHQAHTRNFISNARATYELIDGLKLMVSMGYTDLRTDEVINTPRSSFLPGLQVMSSSVFGDRSGSSWIAEPQISYRKKWGKGQLDMLAGTTWQETLRESWGVRGAGYLSDELLGNINAAASILKMASDEIRYRYNALYGRIAYKWDDKYYINLTGRRDGSSRFGPDKRFANFGAIGLAWIFSSEAFIRRTLPFISFGKLRGSYGTTGSDQIADYGYISTYSSSFATYQGGSVLVPNALANNDYAWEVNKKFELAIDISFLKDRFMISTGWYRNRSGNQLVGYPLPAITGFTSVQANLDAVVQNTGWEFEIMSENIRSACFKWSSSLVLTIPRNKLVSYPNLAGSSYATTYMVGQPLTISKVYKSTGINPQTGFYTFLDVDGNGVLNTNDRQTIINMGRMHYGGINNSLRSGGFELSFFVEFVKQQTRGYMGTFLQPPGQGSNLPAFIYEQTRWKKPGDSDVQLQRTTGVSGTSYNNARSSDLNVDDASFIRLRTVDLSYSLPVKLIKAMKLAEASIYVQGQNLFMITDYKGLDPEIPGNSQVPQLRMITAGVKLKF